MLDILLIAMIGVQESTPQTQEPLITVDPRQGPMPAENIWLRPGHANSDDRMFPDIAVKEMRIDGDTLYVLVTNNGHVSAQKVEVTAKVEANGVNSAGAPARVAKLPAGESKWVSLGSFKVALTDANLVSAAVRLPPAVPAALDRSGQGCVACTDVDETNNSLTEQASSIARGRPE